MAIIGGYLGGKVGGYFDSKIADEKTEQQMMFESKGLADYYGRHK